MSIQPPTIEEHISITIRRAQHIEDEYKKLIEIFKLYNHNKNRDDLLKSFDEKSKNLLALLVQQIGLLKQRLSQEEQKEKKDEKMIKNIKTLMRSNIATYENIENTRTTLGLPDWKQ